MFALNFNIVDSAIGWGSSAALLYGTRYAIRGALSNLGDHCGAISLSLINLPTIAYWWCGAALSFKLSTHYTIRGGASNYDYRCGIFFVDARNTASVSGWDVGASLS